MKDPRKPLRDKQVSAVPQPTDDDTTHEDEIADELSRLMRSPLVRTDEETEE